MARFKPVHRGMKLLPMVEATAPLRKSDTVIAADAGHSGEVNLKGLAGSLSRPSLPALSLTFAHRDMSQTAWPFRLLRYVIYFPPPGGTEPSWRPFQIGRAHV